MYKQKKLPVKKRFLFTGDMQSGKTTDLLKRIITSLEENKNIVEVVINYNTNASMESTNRKLIKMGSSNIKIWEGYEGLEAIYYQIKNNKLDKSRHHVVSLIAHYKSVEKLLQVISAWSTQYNPGSPVFNISIDEDDSLALDHSKKKLIVQKQNRIQAVIEHPLVGIVRNVTATPFANHYSETDFDAMERVAPGEGYIGVEPIIKNANIVRFNKRDITSLYSLEPTPSIQAFFQDTFEGVTLIQITKDKKTQALIVQNLKQICSDSVIALSNSDQGEYTYYVKGKPYGTKSTKFIETEAFDLASKNGIKKVFIVAYYLSDRTNTFRANKGTFNNLRTLFDCSSSAHDETVLQRIGRACGYPKNGIPRVYCTEECYTVLNKALDTHLRFIELEKNTPNIRLAKVRHAALINSGIMGNNIKYTNGARSIAKGSYAFLNAVIMPLLSNKHEDVVPKDIDMTNTNLRINTNLRNYFLNKYNIISVLNTMEPDGDILKRQKMLRPNVERGNKQRTQGLVYFTGGRRYKIIIQYHEIFPKEQQHSIDTFANNVYAVYSPQGGSSV